MNDSATIEKLSEQLNRTTELFKSMCYRYSEQVKEDVEALDELTERRKLRQMWINFIVARKLHARAVEELYDFYRLRRRKVQRVRRVRDDADLLSDYYDSLVSALKHIKDMRIESGRYLMTLDDYIQQRKIQLSDVELKSALSIPEADWREHVKARDDKEISHILFAAGIGDTALCNHVVAEMQHVFRTSDQKTKDRIHWKMHSLGLLPF